MPAFTSKSLHQANLVLALDPAAEVPANELFTGAVTGAAAEGMNFIDDPVIRAKVLHVPKMHLQVVYEGGRLRVEDELVREPDDSTLIEDALGICEKLFPQGPRLRGFGFNFDLVYQWGRMVSIEDGLRKIAPQGLPAGASLLDFGWQWTVAHKDGRLDGYFLKITAPIELTVHFNAHFNERALPAKEKMKKLFAAAYQSPDGVVTSLDI